MAKTLKDTGSTNFKLPVAGTYQGRCYGIAFLGTAPETIKGETSMKTKIRISWELPTEKAVFKEGEEAKPFAVHRLLNESVSEKSDVFKLLNNWTSGLVNKDNIKKFDMEKVLGQHCLLNIIHKPSTKDSSVVYLEVSGISPVPKNMKVEPAFNPISLFDVERFDQKEFNKLPKFLRERTVTTEEFKALKLNATEVLAATDNHYAAASGDDAFVSDTTDNDVDPFTV